MGDGHRQSWGNVGGVSLLAIVVRAVAFGYMEEEEKAGRRFYRAEWPIPGSEVFSDKEELRLAA